MTLVVSAVVFDRQRPSKRDTGESERERERLKNERTKKPEKRVPQRRRQLSYILFYLFFVVFPFLRSRENETNETIARASPREVSERRREWVREQSARSSSEGGEKKKNAVHARESTRRGDERKALDGGELVRWWVDDDGRV